MEEIEKSFLEDWKNVIKELKALGLISEKQIKTGVKIPIELIADKKINREFLQQIIIYMHEKAHSLSGTKHQCKYNPSLVYYEKDGEPILQIIEPKGITYFANIKLPVNKGDTYKMRYLPKYACIALGTAAFNLKKEQLMGEGLDEESAYKEVCQTFFEKRGEAGKYISKMFTEGARAFGEFCKQQETPPGYLRRAIRKWEKEEMRRTIVSRTPTATGVEEVDKILSGKPKTKEIGGITHG